MKIPEKTPKRGLAKTTTVDLVSMALLAGMGIATKNIITPVAKIIATPLLIPAGAIAGGLYMMWLVIAFGIVRKVGAATMTSLVQAIISLLAVFGNFGVLSLIIYLGPGLAADGFFLSSRHKACCAPCCFGASAAANAVGTALVGKLIFVLPTFLLLFSTTVAAIFGGIGGLVAYMLLVECRKIGIGVA